MGIMSLKNKVEKRIKQETIHKDYQEIGSFIKKRRKDLNLTQDTISNGICSVSYLSKIENNQISPNEFFVREIMNKLEIEEDFLQKNLDDREYLEKTIQYIFYLDYNGLDTLKVELDDIENNLTINICKFGLETLMSSSIPSESIMNLENLVLNMNNLELRSYLLFSAIYFISHDDYKTALEVLLMSFELPTNNDFLEALINEYTYYVKQRLLKKNSSLQHFDEAQRIYLKYLNNVRAMKLVLRKILYLSDENPKLALKHLETVKTTLLTGFNLDYYFYIKGMIAFHLERYSDSIASLSNIKEESELHISKLILLYEICIQENDKEMMYEIRKLMGEYQLKKANMKDKVYYHLLIEQDEQEQKEYLRDIAIPFSIKTSDYTMLKKYTDKIMDICINNSRYKEATQYYKKYHKELQRVEKILFKI